MKARGPKKERAKLKGLTKRVNASVLPKPSSRVHMLKPRLNSPACSSKIRKYAPLYIPLDETTPVLLQCVI